MSESGSNLQRKLANARDLQSVVRTMKALAASNIGQFEKSVLALREYSNSVELGLGACFRSHPSQSKQLEKVAGKSITAIVIGSDQGLVGQFNDVVVKFTKTKIASIDAKRQIWSIGGRVRSRLEENGFSSIQHFEVPNSVKAITSLISNILISFEKENGSTDLYLFYNKTSSGTLYDPVCLQLLPLDKVWEKKMIDVVWPSKLMPQLVGSETLGPLIREYLFISMFRACAESLKAENSSRLASMQRADKNIGELIESLGEKFNHLRQSQIDEELFDVLAGFENLAKQPNTSKHRHSS